MLGDQDIDFILGRIPQLTIGVLGDLFLDRYLDINAALTEPSLETGLDAYQVVQVRSYPGAAGTVINNLVALGVKNVRAISVIGDDGEAYELIRALGQLRIVDITGCILDSTRRTPTYTKPMLKEPGQAARELNRLDIKNRSQMTEVVEKEVLHSLVQAWKQLDALVVSDQVSEGECGVITTKVRNRLGELAETEPTKVILADSRERIGLFRSVWLKPNLRECIGAIAVDSEKDPASCVRALATRVGRPVFCTRGDQGILIADPRSNPARILEVPAFAMTGPVDIVGAGDSANAAIACALAAGCDLAQAGAFGCLIASITVQQIGTTGTATPEQIRKRWQEVRLY